MDKKKLVEELNSVETNLREVFTTLKGIKDTLKPRNDIKQRCEKASLLWFEQIEPNLVNFEIKKTIVDSYHGLFDELLKLSVSSSRVKMYIGLIQPILTNFKKDSHMSFLKKL